MFMRIISLLLLGLACQLAAAVPLTDPSVKVTHEEKEINGKKYVRNSYFVGNDANQPIFSYPTLIDGTHIANEFNDWIENIANTKNIDLLYGDCSFPVNYDIAIFTDELIKVEYESSGASRCAGHKNYYFVINSNNYGWLISKSPNWLVSNTESGAFIKVLAIFEVHHSHENNECFTYNAEQWGNIEINIDASSDGKADVRGYRILHNGGGVCQTTIEMPFFKARRLLLNNKNNGTETLLDSYFTNDHYRHISIWTGTIGKSLVSFCSGKGGDHYSSDGEYETWDGRYYYKNIGKDILLQQDARDPQSYIEGSTQNPTGIWKITKKDDKEIHGEWSSPSGDKKLPIELTRLDTNVTDYDFFYPACVGPGTYGSTNSESYFYNKMRNENPKPVASKPFDLKAFRTGSYQPKETVALSDGNLVSDDESFGESHVNFENFLRIELIDRLYNKFGYDTRCYVRNVFREPQSASLLNDGISFHMAFDSEDKTCDTDVVVPFSQLKPYLTEAGQKKFAELKLN